MTSYLKMQSLTLLNLQQNRLTSFTNDVEYDVTNRSNCQNRGCALETLHLGLNVFSTFSTELFGYFPNLQNLYLSNNFLERLEMGWFESTPDVENLNLANNSISYITYDNNPNFSNLSLLDLSRNLIEDFDQILVQQLTATHFDVRWNRLTNLNFLAGFTFQNLNILAEHNPWNCSCRFQDSYQIIMNSNITFECATGEAGSCVLCEDPIEVQGTSVWNISTCTTTTTTVIVTNNTSNTHTDSSNIAVVAVAIFPIITLSFSIYRIYKNKRSKKLKTTDKETDQVTVIRINNVTITQANQPDASSSNDPRSPSTTPFPPHNKPQSIPESTSEYVSMSDQLEQTYENKTITGPSVYCDDYLIVPTGQSIPFQTPPTTYPSALSGTDTLPPTLPERNTYNNFPRNSRSNFEQPDPNESYYTCADDVYDDIDNNSNKHYSIQRDKTVYLKPFN